VILCLGRSGSTHLQSLLDSHPDIRCFGELFSDRSEGDSVRFVNSPHGDAAAYLAERLSGHDEHAAGFKLPMNSIRAHPKAAEAVRADPELRVIRLSRKNLLAQLVSRRLLAESGVAHSIHGSYGDARIRIEPDLCLRALSVMEQDESELDEIAAGKATLRLTYEELAAGERLDDVQRFLDVLPQQLRSWFEKLRTRPLRESVSNWDELVEVLTGTRYERLLRAGG